MMEGLKKSWWFFGVLGTAAALLNPYVGLFACFPAVILFICGISIGVGRTRCRQKNQPGYNGIARMQSYSFWFLLLWDIIFVPIVVGMIIFFTTTPNRKILTPLSTQGFDFANWVPLLMVVAVAFEALSIILAAFRQYDLYWSKTYTLKPKHHKTENLNQPRENSSLYSLFQIMGRGWAIFAALSFAAGLFSIRFPALTLLRIFLLLPYFILLINVRARQSMIRRFAANPQAFPAYAEKVAQDQLNMFTGKGMFLVLIFAMILIEGMIVMCELILPVTSGFALYISLFFDVSFLLSLGFELWNLAEKKRNPAVK